jgi:hypothetical protein
MFREELARQQQQEALAKQIVEERGDLQTSLRNLRQAFATRLSCRDWQIFSDVALNDMTVKLPSSQESLLKVHGIGPTKLKNFGEPILQVVRYYRRFYEKKKKDSKVMKNNKKETPDAASRVRRGVPSLPSATEYNMQRYDTNHQRTSFKNSAQSEASLFRPALSAGGLVAERIQNTKTGTPAVATVRRTTARGAVRQPAAVAAAPIVVDLVDTDDENDECTVGTNEADTVMDGAERPEDDDDDDDDGSVFEMATLSLEEIVNNRFEQAAASGEMISID